MKPCVRLWRTSVGKKALAAFSGLVFFGYLCLHALGNLTAFAGAGSMDGYARALRRMAPLLWGVRVGLATAVVVHVLSTLSLARRARDARPVSAEPRPPRGSTLSSRTLRVGGPLLLGFLVYHLGHVTFGVVHPSFVAGGVYHNVLVTGLAPRWVTAVYLLAAVLVGMHLFHALYAARTSLGIAPPSPAGSRRRVAAAVAVTVAVGFAAVPVAVALGVVR